MRQNLADFDFQPDQFGAMAIADTSATPSPVRGASVASVTRGGITVPRLASAVPRELKAAGGSQMWALLARGLIGAGLLSSDHVRRGENANDVIRLAFSETIDACQPAVPEFGFNVRVGDTCDDFTFPYDRGDWVLNGQIFLGVGRSKSELAVATIGPALAELESVKPGLSAVVTHALEAAFESTIGGFGFNRAFYEAEHLIWYGQDTDDLLREEIVAMNGDISEEEFAGMFKPSDFAAEIPNWAMPNGYWHNRRAAARIVRDAFGDGGRVGECARKTGALRELLAKLSKQKINAWHFPEYREECEPAVVFRFSATDRIPAILDDAYQYWSQADEWTDLRGFTSLDGSSDSLCRWFSSLALGGQIIDAAVELVRLLDDNFGV